MDYSDYSIKQLAAHIAQQLNNKGLEVVIVGGLAVEFYTHNKYLTIDIDMIDRSYQTKTLHQAMSDLGFSKKNKYYTHPTTEYFIEFPSAPLEVAGELIEKINFISTEFGEVPIIELNDIIKDRLAAYLHWGDIPSLFQALCMMATHQVSAKEFKRFFIEQTQQQKFNIFERRLKAVNLLSEISLSSIEEALTDDILNEKISTNYQ